MIRSAAGKDDLWNRSSEAALCLRATFSHDPTRASGSQSGKDNVRISSGGIPKRNGRFRPDHVTPTHKCAQERTFGFASIRSFRLPRTLLRSGHLRGVFDTGVFAGAQVRKRRAATDWRLIATLKPNKVSLPHSNLRPFERSLGRTSVWRAEDRHVSASQFELDAKPEDTCSMPIAALGEALSIVYGARLRRDGDARRFDLRCVGRKNADGRCRGNRMYRLCSSGGTTGSDRFGPAPIDFCPACNP